jgi:hypothetical protein
MGMVGGTVIYGSCDVIVSTLDMKINNQITVRL